MELRTKLIWLIVLRLLIATALLGSAALMGIVQQITDLPLLLLIGVYLFSLLYLLVWRIVGRYELLLYFQLVIDLSLVSILVFHTGGIDSTFTSLYMVIVVYSSILLGRQGGIIGTLLSTIFYLGTLWAGYFLGLSSLGVNEWKPIYFKLLLNLVAFVSLLYLVVYLFERVKMTRMELEETNISLGNLQALNENIVNSIRSGLITTDLNGNIITFNDGAAEITGHRETMHGMHVSSVIGDWLWGKILSTNFSKERNPLRCELWRKTQQGKDVYLGAGATPLYTKKGKHVGYIISFQDLTETKKLEEEIKLKEKMAAIGNLAAGIAHEIRNPLASIKGSIQLLQSELELKDEKRKLMDIVVRESNRLNKIVEDFLTYARPKKYNMKRLNVSNLLSDVIGLLKNSPEISPEHRIETLFPENGCEIVADSDQIKQVFWNLAQNSLKAMPNGGRLVIVVDKGNNESIKISFSDSGIGMTEEEVKQVFQPFYSQFSRGVGLGMSIVYQIVYSHSGKIHVHSRKGMGTTITLEFPTG